ncbi:MAG TPA: GTPase HflX [Candidatus Omnitrophota bacterium]|nr:GTPase HflX [Candidatus Omnitrophota bacterium]
MARDKAFLVIVKSGAKNCPDPLDVLEEMKELTESAHGAVVGSVTANVPHPSPSHYIRKGKIEEIHTEIHNTNANVLIFSVDLSPVQARNLEEACGVRVVDRTGLILDIFARRAVSSDGKLQVELAQLQYLLPRLVGMGVIMSRLGGGIGTRGPGEQKLEVDRRRIRGRIEHIQKQLEKLRVHRAQIRQGRRQKGLRQVAIVGYTNAGKSTLLNALTGADAYVENRLFATLDPKTRIYEDGSGKSILFTDTVGFIRELPHGLVKAFHATLEEVLDADLILVVVDAASEHAMEHKQVVDQVLEELGAGAKEKLLVLNKADLLSDVEMARIQDVFPEGIMISSLTKAGFPNLIRTIQETLKKIDDWNILKKDSNVE